MINAEDRLISFTRENLPPPDSEIQAYLDGLKARADKRMLLGLYQKLASITDKLLSSQRVESWCRFVLCEYRRY